MRIFYCVMLGAFFVLFFPSSASAEVVFERVKSSGKMTLKISGRIDDNMFQYFESYLNHIKNKKIALHMNAVQLDSSGGDLQVALKMGALIRQAKLNTFVDPVASCKSACVLVLMGGIERMPYGQINIHRPALVNINQTMIETKIEESIVTSQNLIANYTRDMGLSQNLADAINTTPNWASRSPEPIEMRRWGLEGMTQASEVALSLVAGSKFKMSKDQFDEHMQENWIRCRTAAIRFEKSPRQCLESLLLTNGI